MHQSEPSLIAAKQYLDLIDFSKIINKMVITDRWVKKDALQTCQFYKNFLFLKKNMERNMKSLPLWISMNFGITIFSILKNMSRTVKLSLDII